MVTRKVPDIRGTSPARRSNPARHAFAVEFYSARLGRGEEEGAERVLRCDPMRAFRAKVPRAPARGAIEDASSERAHEDTS